MNNEVQVKASLMCVVLVIALYYATRSTQWLPIQFARDQTPGTTNVVHIGIRSDGVVVWRER